MPSGQAARSPERLLRTIRLARALLLFSLIAAAMLVMAAVAAGAAGPLGVAAKIACLWAALVAFGLLVLNLVALRIWRQQRANGGAATSDARK